MEPTAIVTANDEFGYTNESKDSFQIIIPILLDKSEDYGLAKNWVIMSRFLAPALS